MEGVASLVGEVQPAFIFDCRVLWKLTETIRPKIAHVPGAFRFHIFTTQSFPDLSAIERVGEVAGHARVPQQVMRDAIDVLPRQAHLRHAAGRPAGVGLPEKLGQTAEAIFLVERAQRSGSLREQLGSLRIARRVTGRTAARMEETIAMLRGDRIGRLWGKVALPHG